MIIAITGTPGTGKTEVAKVLSKFLTSWKVIHINDLVHQKKLYVGYDESRKSYEVDMERLKKEIESLEQKHKNLLIESHIAHLLPCDIVVVLRCHPKEIMKRLEKKYSWPTKIYENVEAEALNVIAEEAREKCEKVYEIDTTGLTVEEVAKQILKIVEGKEVEEKQIDWLSKGDVQEFILNLPKDLTEKG